MSLSMKDKSNRKKRYILAGIFLGIATLLGIERCVNDEPESEQRIEQKKADKAPSQSSTPRVSSSLDKTNVQKDSGRSDCVYNKLGNVPRNVTSINTRRIKMSELSELSGVNKNTILSLYHNRVKRVDFDTLEKIAKPLNISPLELLEYTPD